MNTPICDFVRDYARSGMLRLHMPGHKGAGPLGVEALDITEVSGADSLYEADGIIRESEKNASELFGCATYYSTEGSSLCIRAMLYLAMLHAQRRGKKQLVAAGRNAHKTFLSAAALLDLDVMWIDPAEGDSYLSCRIEADALDVLLGQASEKPCAVYLTSPDYLGNTLDLAAMSAVCRKHGALLLVDNAHGAYLKFLPVSRHPIDLGADMCCDSAHKTLPVLTGGAYLHLSEDMADETGDQVRNALALFGSTSPSYLILQSLDAANRTLAEGYAGSIANFIAEADRCKAALKAHGYILTGNEPLKLTLCAHAWGYTGTEIADHLRRRQIECEFADPDFIVFMLAPEIGAEGLKRLQEALMALPRKDTLPQCAPAFRPAERVLSIRSAMFADREVIPVRESAGRILAAASVGCPPAVPILVCGERIDEHAIECFEYYGIDSCIVVKAPTVL